MIHRIDIPQREADWYAERLGRATGTDASSLFSMVKRGSLAVGGLKATANKIASVIASEIITGLSEEDFFTNDDMEYGISYEPEAREAYAKKYKTDVTVYGFVRNDKFKYFGYSPDGHTKGNTEDIQIKCPAVLSNFINATQFGVVDAKYKMQCIYPMAVDTDLQRTHLVYYCPRQEIKPEKRLIVVETFEREKYESMLAGITESMIAFEVMVDAILDNLLP